MLGNILKDFQFIQSAAKDFFGDETHYDHLINAHYSFEEITKEILSDGQKLRAKGLLDKGIYKKYKSDIRDLLIQKSEEEEKERFLDEPKNDLEKILEEKFGFKKAKISSGRVLLISPNGDELDIQYEDHHGLTIRVDNDYYNDPDGL